MGQLLRFHSGQHVLLPSSTMLSTSTLRSHNACTSPRFNSIRSMHLQRGELTVSLGLRPRFLLPTGGGGVAGASCGGSTAASSHSGMSSFSSASEVLTGVSIVDSSSPDEVPSSLLLSEVPASEVRTKSSSEPVAIFCIFWVSSRPHSTLSFLSGCSLSRVRSINSVPCPARSRSATGSKTCVRTSAPGWALGLDACAGPRR
mmetsp:Transcript_3094/g.5856  ORF Transcript_3094/g.5856 Transcript_3094/m.5856 type:complete len:202 (-) Transcript_3094:28-633(-)